ncbi:unnamed protein product [Schistocephalus solidus]|uniref:DUF862 domain-containing protein n=1 Tax=Schistocephalus solidus TaxID=70667 RepID=A0A183SIZ6_SCHSO|nr:unnamed protein product [Schistocephalus solidus]
MCLLTAPKKPKTDVYLFVYDLSHGVSNLLSESLLGSSVQFQHKCVFAGKHLEGIWHTAVVVFGSEYFFGVHGVRKCKPVRSALVSDACLTHFVTGNTSAFLTLLHGREGTYDLFEHNCIYFSEDVIRHLTGKSIPEEILHLPSEILSTPIGQVVKPAVEGILQVMNRESQLVKEIRRVVYGAGSGRQNASLLIVCKSSFHLNHLPNVICSLPPVLALFRPPCPSSSPFPHPTPLSTPTSPTPLHLSSTPYSCFYPSSSPSILTLPSFPTVEKSYGEATCNQVGGPGESVVLSLTQIVTHSGVR